MLELKLFYFVCSWFCFIIVTPICNNVLFSCYMYATLSQDQLKWRQNTKPLSCKNCFLCIIVQHCCDIVECDLYIVLTSLEMILFSEKFNCVMVLEVYSVHNLYMAVSLNLIFYCAITSYSLQKIIYALLISTQYFQFLIFMEYLYYATIIYLTVIVIPKIINRSILTILMY